MEIKRDTVWFPVERGQPGAVRIRGFNLSRARRYHIDMPLYMTTKKKKLNEFAYIKSLHFFISRFLLCKRPA